MPIFIMNISFIAGFATGADLLLLPTRSSPLQESELHAPQQGRFACAYSPLFDPESAGGRVIHILKTESWRACNLTAFTHSLTGPSGHPFASCHEGPGFIPGGGGGTYVKPGFSYLCETRILLLM
jgi:hypothetical protein